MTAYPLLQVLTGLSVSEVVATISDTGTVYPAPADPARLHFKLCGGLADGYARAFQADPKVLAEYDLDAPASGVSVLVDYDRSWKLRDEVLRLLASIFVDLSQDDRFSAGLIGDPGLVLLATWSEARLDLCEPEKVTLAKVPTKLAEEVMDNYVAWSREILRISRARGFQIDIRPTAVDQQWRLDPI